MGRMKEAVQASQDALAWSAPLDEQSGWAHGRLDILYTRMGRENPAAIERGMALSAVKGNAWQHFDQGSQYEKYGLGEAAPTQYQEAIRQGTALRAATRPGHGTPAKYSASPRLKPGLIWLVNIRGMRKPTPIGGALYAARSDFAKAGDCYRKAVDLEPHNHSYAENLRSASPQSSN